MLRSMVVMGLLVVGIIPARAGTYVDASKGPTYGCGARLDTLWIMAGGKIEGTDSSSFAAAASRIHDRLMEKVRKGKCFLIPGGVAAYIHTEDQAPRDPWYGVARLTTKAGRKFYTPILAWRYVGEAPEFMY